MMEEASQVAATIRIELKADSGYSATVEGRISASQWGEICAIIHRPRQQGEKED